MKSRVSNHIVPRYRLLGEVAIFAILISGLVVLPNAQSAQALSGSDFDAGQIIDDSKFYDSNAMSEAQIQAFLTSMGSGLQGMRFPVASRARSVSDSTGNVRCEAFSGGSTLLASTIIFRTQIACGISAKVILVTLQKEQGLVSKASPSQAALDRAMGMACPDTAACATDKLGFGNQVYEGSKQLKTYKASNFGLQPGVRTIRWNPNAACGGSTFQIKNYATAALYNYTPYRPNAAALVNVNGTGDGCSSYGNRNFWVYYNNWFGPTGVTAPPGPAIMATLYQQQGGANGWLGSATSPFEEISANGGGFRQAFVGGTIYYSSDGAARIVSGAILAAYAAQNAQAGSLGWPTGNVTEVTAQGALGQYQEFQNGVVTWTPTSGSLVVAEAIGFQYLLVEGVDGFLGWPIGTANYDSSRGGGLVQKFQSGSIYSTNETGPRIVSGTTLSKYVESGGPSGQLGWAVGDVGQSAANGGGQGQAFQNGSIYYSPAAGAFAVTGVIRDSYWAALGEGGVLGWPTSAAATVSANGGGVAQTFQGGSIFSSSRGARAVTGAVLSAYASAGGVGGLLGWPSSNLLTLPGGKAQAFQGGSIYQSGSIAYPVSGPIRDFYFAALGEGGVLGYPTATATCGLPDGGCSQTFQNGSIIWSPSTGARFGSIPQIDAVYTALGGVGGSLGKQTSGVISSSANGGGQGQAFQNGSIYYSPAAGAFAVTGVIRLFYWARLGESGTLGWPTGAKTCVQTSGVCAQSFQHGSIISSPSGSVALG